MASATASASSSGRVKWFNNKAGYGFITLIDAASKEERDIFVHHSEIQVGQTQYKYLVQGEYVEFTLSPIVREGKSDDVHATSVRGVNGGKLMCETRNEVRVQRVPTSRPAKQHAQQQPQAQKAQESRPQESRRPQLDKADQTEWMIVPRRRTEQVASSAARKPAAKPRQRQPEIEIK